MLANAFALQYYHAYDASHKYDEVRKKNIPPVMPRTSSLLSQDDWIDFGRWLEAQRQKLDDGDPRKAKTAIANALERAGGASTGEINVYFSGKRLPLEASVRRLARHLGASEELALLRAGYAVPLIHMLPDLLHRAYECCKQDGIAFAQCTVPNGVGQELDAERYMSAQIPFGFKTRPIGRFQAPWSAVLAAYIAVAGFPLRGEKRQDGVWSSLGALLDAQPSEGIMKRKPGKLPHELDVAIKLLKDRTLNTEQRRAASGELVRAWILRECGRLAEAVIAGTYHLPTPSICEIQFIDDEPDTSKFEDSHSSATFVASDYASTAGEPN